MAYKQRKHKCFFVIIFSIFLSDFFAQNSTPQGVRLFEQNKTFEAISFLESDIKSGRAIPIEYNYLGLAYYKLSAYEKSVEVFKKGISAAGTSKKVLYFNLGNTYFAMGDYQSALESYYMATVADSLYAEPVLNKANTEVNLNMLKDAIVDYKKYLELCPESPQRPKIERLITLLENELTARAQAERLAEEEAARIKVEQERLAKEKAERERLEAERQAEENRLAAEKRAEEERIAAEKLAEEERIAAEKRAVEEERRRKMLEDVANSLRKNSDATNMSADAESALKYDYESDIE